MSALGRASKEQRGFYSAFPNTSDSSLLPSSPTQPHTPRTHRSNLSSDTQNYGLLSDPWAWGSTVSPNYVEPDDDLHTPDPRRDKRIDHGGSLCTVRAFVNLGCLAIIAIALFALFAGYPVASYFTTNRQETFGAFNVGGTNATGQVPSMPGNWGLIDLDTPQEVYTRPSYYGGKPMRLVFSDEFNVDGRTFYPGDDPYWEAVDLHYWGTGNMEWYDPAAVTTRNGALEITLSEKNTHDLDYQGGMIQSWNKFCFTGGLVEAAVTLPGDTTTEGLWPAIWMMGNLGRAGFGASLDGMWPYTYDSCDVGTLPNQTLNNLPVAARGLSYLPGQRLSRCTCEGEEHPGPFHADGTYVGRASPEIDLFEAQVKGGVGHVSISSQWAPFNNDYEWFNVSNAIIEDPTHSALNEYKGGIWQQATSVEALTNPLCYEFTGGCFAIYGVEYTPGFDDAYISWINDGRLDWTLLQPGMAADTVVEIGPRPVPQEPMYLIANLGMSEGFGGVDLANLIFPTTMRIDWIRVYQEADKVNVGCDPPDFPTKAYIERFPEAYSNPNLTTWVDDYHQVIPRNSMVDVC